MDVLAMVGLGGFIGGIWAILKGNDKMAYLCGGLVAAFAVIMVFAR